jgi:hypothetical protein
MSFAAAILAGMLSTSPSWAQEEGTVPGAMPDPSTYQGSMEMQRQSDAQDQQFREQQSQQPYYGQPAPGYGGGTRMGGGAYPGLWPSQVCMNQVRSSRLFAPLAGKIDLGGGDPQHVQLFSIHSGPTPREKILIGKWLAARRRCDAIWLTERPTPNQIAARNRWGVPALPPLIAALLSGRLTYGEFAYRRAMNAVNMTRFVAANR